MTAHCPRRPVEAVLRALLLLFALALAAGGRPARADGLEEVNRAVGEAVREILASTPLGQARTGILVYDLEAKRPVFEHNADALLNPASNMKILTTVAALATLGPAWRYPTEVFVATEPVDGVVQGDLYLRGKGDPSLDTERLYRIVRELKFLGLREVRGNLVVDDTWFDSQYEGPGWEQDDADRPYMAGAGALSLNFNSVAVHVHPGAKEGEKVRVFVDPPSDYILVENNGITTSGRSRQRLAVRSIDLGEKQKIVVEARMPAGRRGGPVWRRISNPPVYTGESFKRMLEEHGIRVRGRVRKGRVPEQLRPFHVDWSEPLAVLVHKLNKWSQNHMSEMLLKTLGAEVHGAPGTWAKGVAAVESVLAERVGIPRGSFVMRNGSGLNDTNRLSARQIVQVLAWAREQDLVAPELLASLPVAGVDGTVRNRMVDGPAQGRVRAKTGTLQNVTALAGYVRSVEGRQLAFAILVNDYPGRLSRVIPGVDAVGAVLAGAGSAGGAQRVAEERPPPTPIDILGARMVTYRNLGLETEADNGLFLWTSLHAERDPAVRVVIAEALHRSAPEVEGVREAILAALAEAPPLYGRLREAAERVGLPIPLVGTLGELAIDGSPRALELLLALAAQRPDDGPLQAELSRTLAAVGSAAPRELFTALSDAPDQTREVGARLLGRGLAREMPEQVRNGSHPFTTTLATVARGEDPVLASFAKSLETMLASSVAGAEREAQAASGN